MSSIDFPLILVILTFVSGVIWLFDHLFFKKAREAAKKKEPWFVDYSRSFFPIFLIVLVIRSFIIQPYTVPTGSLEPTVQPGDFVAVNQFIYGLRLPVLNTKILNISEPKRGDIVVFRWPADPSVNFIKRVVGVPGDHLVYKNRVLYVNEKEMSQQFVRNGTDFEPPNITMPVKIVTEKLDGKTHQIQLNPDRPNTQDYDLTVPKGQYFMMGDNRDSSEDSRFWGFVPEKNIEGKAFFIWMSWNRQRHWFDFGRIGTRL